MAGACGALLTLQYLIYDWKPPLQVRPRERRRVLCLGLNILGGAAKLF
jgi:hypothetical protein